MGGGRPASPMGTRLYCTGGTPSGDAQWQWGVGGRLLKGPEVPHEQVKAVGQQNVGGVTNMAPELAEA